MRVDTLLFLAMYFFHRKPVIAVKMSLRMGFFKKLNRNGKRALRQIASEPKTAPDVTMQERTFNVRA